MTENCVKMEFIKNYLIKSVTSVILLGAIIILSSQFYGEDPRLRMVYQGEIFGVALIRSLLTFIAGLILIRLPRTKLDGWLLCFTIALSFGVYNQSVNAKSRGQYNKFQNEMTRLAESLENGTSYTLLDNYSVKEYGDFSKLMPLYVKANRFEEELAKEMIQLSLCFEQLPAYTELNNLENYNKAKNILSNFKLSIKECEKKHTEHQESLENFIRQTVFEDYHVKQSVLRGFQKGKKRSVKLMNEFFSLFYTLSDTMNELIDFLFVKHGSINISEDRFIFANAEDERIYMDIDQRLADLVYEEVFLNKKMLEFAQDYVDSLKNMGRWD